MADRKTICDAIRRKRGAMKDAPDAVCLELWRFMTPAAQEQYLEDLKAAKPPARPAPLTSTRKAKDDT